ncbi:hypothetical protein Efla_004229 [Eimeria flavescens]
MKAARGAAAACTLFVVRLKQDGLMESQAAAAEPPSANPWTKEVTPLSLRVAESARPMSLCLFDGRTPRTSTSVGGRWTAEFAIIKAALMRQRAAKNVSQSWFHILYFCHPVSSPKRKAVRGPAACSCCHSKSVSREGSKGFACAATLASQAFAEAAHLTPRGASRRTQLHVLWGPPLVAESAAAAAEASAAVAEEHRTRPQQRKQPGWQEGPQQAASPPELQQQIPGFMRSNAFSSQASKAAFAWAYRAAAATVAASSARAQELVAVRLQAEPQQQPEAPHAASSKPFFLTVPDLPGPQAAAHEIAQAARCSSNQGDALPQRAAAHPGQQEPAEKQPRHAKPLNSGVTSTQGAPAANRGPPKELLPSKQTASSSFWRRSVNSPVAFECKLPAAAWGRAPASCSSGGRDAAAAARQPLAEELLRRLSLLRRRRPCGQAGGSARRSRSEDTQTNKRSGLRRLNRSAVSGSSRRQKARWGNLQEEVREEKKNGQRRKEPADRLPEDCEPQKRKAFLQRSLVIAANRRSRSSMGSRLPQRVETADLDAGLSAEAPPGIPRLQLGAVQQAEASASSFITSSRRLPTLQEFIKRQRHLQDVASEAAGGTWSFDPLQSLLLPAAANATQADIQWTYTRDSSSVATRGALTSELLQQQLQQLAAGNPSLAGRPESAGSESQHAAQANNGGTRLSSIRRNPSSSSFCRAGGDQPSSQSTNKTRAATGRALEKLRESMRARSRAKETANRTLAALLGTRALRNSFDAATRIELMQQARSRRPSKEQLALDVLEMSDKQQRGANAADFVEAWYTDLLVAAAAGLTAESNSANKQEDSAAFQATQNLLELMRNSLQTGLRYEVLIDFVCGLEEREVRSSLSKVLIRSTFAFEEPLAELRNLVEKVKENFGRIPPALQSQLLHALRSPGRRLVQTKLHRCSSREEPTAAASRRSAARLSSSVRSTSAKCCLTERRRRDPWKADSEPLRRWR